MKDCIRFEFDKLFKRRFSVIYLVITAIVLPVLIVVTSHLTYAKEQIPEGLFAENIAGGVIRFTQVFFALPVWILIFVGQEFSNGHVNRVVFTRSKKFYIMAKIIYCVLISLYFTLVALVSFHLAMSKLPVDLISDYGAFYWRYSWQVFMSVFSYSILLLAVVFVFRSPLSFIYIIIWTIVENLLFVFFKVKWLPFHLVQSLYAIGGDTGKTTNYYNPFFNAWAEILPPVIFVALLIAFIYYHFNSKSLKPLSD